MPYIAYNVPEVDETVKKWGDVDYLNDMLKFLILKLRDDEIEIEGEM